MPERSVLQHAGKVFRTHRMSSRIQAITVSAIKEMSMLAMQYDDVIPFAWGLPSFVTPEHIRQASVKALLEKEDVGKYAPLPGLADLRKAIAATVKRKFDVTVNPMTETMVTVGGMEGLMDTLHAVLDPGDEVLLTTPGFSSHVEQVTLVGGVPVFVPLIEEKNWALDLKAFENTITPRTKAIILCNPSNPTGSLLSEEQVRGISAIALKYDLFVITDEPYNFLVYDGKPLFTFIQVPEMKPNLITICSLSKEYCMTGFRIGYIIAEEGIINQLQKPHDSTVISACTLAQYAAIEALTGPQDCAVYFRDELQKRRDIMCARLDVLKDFFSYAKPEGAYYIFPKLIGEHQDAIPLAMDILDKARVSVVPGDAFGPTGKGHVRLCFGTTEDKINQGFDRLEKYFKK